MYRRLPVWNRSLMALAVLSIAGCSDIVVSDRDVVIDALGAVRGFAYLDLDGNATFGQGDQPFPGLRLQLRSSGNEGLIRTAVTGIDGNFAMDSVPVGSFDLVLEPETAPDTVEISGLAPGTLIVLADSLYQVELRASFPSYSLAEVRGLAPGQRVITHGIALSARVSTDPEGVVHLTEAGAYLRTVGVDRATVGVGDSVRFIGRTATDAGQPILEDVRPFRLVAQAVFVQAVDVTSGEATTAKNASLDAALVRVRNAVIEDTVSVGANLIVRANDGSGSIDLVLKDFLAFNTGGLKPDSAYFTQAIGLLVPTLGGQAAPLRPTVIVQPQVGPGDVRWRMTPRGNGDLAVTPVPVVGAGQVCQGRLAFSLVSVPDDNLRPVIRSAVGVGSGEPLTCGLILAAGLTELSVPSAGIVSLVGIQTLTSLQTLSLAGNAITQITALSGLTSLRTLGLANNVITNLSVLEGLTGLMEIFLNGNLGLSNIQPLLNNPGLGAGDTVHLESTNVSCVDVAALQAKGVTVTSGCP